MEHFPGMYKVLDGAVCTIIPSDKKEYSSDCAFQFTSMVFKSRQKSGHFNQKEEIEFLHNSLTEKYIRYP